VSKTLLQIRFSSLRMKQKVNPIGRALEDCLRQEANATLSAQA
jgi:hypothetical protein